MPAWSFYDAPVRDDIRDMRDNAERFRRLARIIEDERNRRQLLEMAKELDEGADTLEKLERNEKP